MTVAIVSLNFSVGHVAYLRAFYLAIKHRGINSILMLNKAYANYIGTDIPEDDIVYADKAKEYFEIAKKRNIKPKLYILYNISTQNKIFIKTAKKNGGKTAYVLHEPFPGFKKAKNEKKKIYAFGSYYINYTNIKAADHIILPSEYAVSDYEKYCAKSNRNYSYFPLLMEDLYTVSDNTEKSYFSFIGAFILTHNCDKFLEFVKYASDKDPNIRFCIATKKNIDQYISDCKIVELIQKGILTVQHGRNMTSEEINSFYKNSICVWNLYKRSTQSGVTVNAMMMGTPVIANNTGSFPEIINNGENGFLLPYEFNNEDIFEAYTNIKQNIQSFSQEARNTFLNKYHYLNNAEKLEKLIEMIINNIN